MARSLPESSSWANMQPKAKFETDKYRSKGRPGVGDTKTGGDNKYSLTLSNARWHWSSQIVVDSFHQESKNRLTNVCQSVNESANVLKSTQEASDLSLCPRCRYVKDGSNLVWIYLYTSLTDHISKELPRSHSKSALLGIQSQFELPDPLKEPLQSCQVIWSISGFHYHVIYINLDIPMHYVMAECGRCSMISGSCILQSEWHDYNNKYDTR